MGNKIKQNTYENESYNTIDCHYILIVYSYVGIKLKYSNRRRSSRTLRIKKAGLRTRNHHNRTRNHHSKPCQISKWGRCRDWWPRSRFQKSKQKTKEKNRNYRNKLEWYCSESQRHLIQLRKLICWCRQNWRQF